MVNMVRHGCLVSSFSKRLGCAQISDDIIDVAADHYTVAFGAKLVLKAIAQAGAVSREGLGG
jgi:hypothetical protein